MPYFPFGAQTYFLGSSIGSTDSSILLSSFLEPVTGTPYTMALINSSIVFATISPKTTSSEFISFTGITQNSNGTATLTGVTRGLAKKYPFTSDSTYKLPHAGQSTFIISDAPQVFNEYVTLLNAETISGIKIFATGATPLVTDAPTTPTMAVNKAYADGLAIAGAPNASTTVQGLVQEATLAQVLARTVTGSTGAKLFIPLDKNIATLISDYAIDTGAANAYAIAPTPALTAYVTGGIFTFKSTHANTTTSTLAVSGLATKTIKNSQGNNLNANDIINGQLIMVQYDGTNMQMLNISGNGYVDLATNQTIGGVKSFSGAASQFTALPQSSAVPGTGNDLVNKNYVDGAPRFTLKNGVASRAGDTASGTQNIAHGLGRTPIYVRVTSAKRISGASVVRMANAYGTYNGTTNAVMWTLIHEASADNTTGTSTSAAIFITDNNGGTDQTGVITVDGTNIIITWTKQASPTSDNITMMWEVM